MRLRLFRGRSWWPVRIGTRAADGRTTGAPIPGSPAAGLRTIGPETGPRTTGPESGPVPRAGGARGSHRKVGTPGGGGSGGWPASGMRPGQAPAAGTRGSGRPQPATAATASRAAERAAIKTAPGGPGPALAADLPSTASRAVARQRTRASDGQPWYATARTSRADIGLRHCGCLEDVLIREWEADAGPAPESVTAVNRLADLPLLVKETLAAGLDAIHVGAGGVPDLDHMSGLAGVPLPSGRATWDACAGAYGDRRIIVGSRPSPTPDVMCHEVGHALDDLDGDGGIWQSDSAGFRALYGRCLPHLASEFHRHGSSLGRREFFADAFAAIASSQRPALVEMLSGDTRTALDVMLYFNVRYGM